MSAKGSYYPQMDSLRAFAVAAVAWMHWLPAYRFHLPLSSGVQLFFVISGFLITGILLRARAKSERVPSESKSFILRGFYGRRFLRIFPLYYGVLTIATLLNVSGLRNNYPWHYLYGSNYYYIWKQGWQGTVSHFWTLAVEEQFYLLWPFVILFTPRRYLPGCLGLFAISGPVFRFVGLTFFPGVEHWSLATPGSFDSLALGALLAYFAQCPDVRWSWLLRHRRAIAVGCIGVYVVVYYLNLVPLDLRFLRLTVLSIIFVVLVHETTHGVGGVVGAILSLGPIMYLGRISYGLYVLHPFARIPTDYALRHSEALQQIPGMRITLLVVITVGGAALSWHLYEAPLNRFKRYFPYNQAA